MKKLLVLSFLMILFIGSLFAQGEAPVEETNWVLIIIAGVIAVIEIIGRAIPNKNVTGILGLIINLLKQISDYLNNK